MQKVLLSTQVSEIISFALLGKYNDWSLDELKEYILGILNESNDNATENKSLNNNLLRKDILNQIITFERIESEWKNSVLDINLIKKINAQLRGLNLQKLLYRKGEFVKDFGGEALTHTSEIPKELEKFNKLLKLADNFSEKNEVDEAYLMGKIFCEIIRIHPFEDGNGRTARILVQILARKWGYKFIVIPKYRNDKRWRNALDAGINGEYLLMSYFFKNRLSKI